MSRARINVPFIVFALAIAGCDSDLPMSASLAAGVDESVIPTGAAPFIVGSPNGPAVVTGCTWTNELGQVNGGWGNMLPGSGVAFPNPTNGPVVLTYAIPKDVGIVWWVEVAYGPGQIPGEPAGQHAGGTVVIPSTIVFGPEEFFASTGVQEYQWNGTDAFGRPVPQGYYRVIAYIPRLGWYGYWDVLIDRN